MKRYVFLPLMLVTAVALAQDAGIGDPTFPTLGNKGYTATHYRLALDFNPSTNLLKADVKMDATATSDLTSFSLDFKGFDISALTVNGSKASFTRAGEKVTITPSSPVQSGTKMVVETVYSGKPAQYQSSALPPGFTAGWITYNGGSAAVCEPNMSHSWYPCNDHPLDKATFDIEVTSPPGFQRVSNGVPSPVSASRTEFKLDKPVLTCMATAVIGKYAILKEAGPGGIPITNFVPVGSEAQYLQTLAPLPKYMQFLIDRLGPYPFSTYGCVLLPKEAGEACKLMNGTALECTTIPIFGGGADASTLIHEMAHQWMGDCVSVTNWGDDIWWVEGFAQYSEWLLLESQKGKAAYDSMVSSIYGQVSSSGKWLKPGHLPVADMFSERSYIGGALTFHALRKKLGDEKFFATLKAFIDKNRYGNASVKDWIEVASKVAGQDMKPFFDEWLYSDKIPALPK